MTTDERGAVDGTENLINAAEGVISHFQKRKETARECLVALAGVSEVCFALSGLTLHGGVYEFAGLGTLREVRQPPGEIELAGALENKGLLSAVARHMPSVTHELAVLHGASNDLQGLLDTGWRIISALRCRSVADLLVPAVASVSWDAIPAVERDSCKVQLLEDVPAARRLGEVVAVSRDELDWVHKHLAVWIELLERPAFRLAVDCLTTHHHQANLRMSAAALWAGFEGIFGINSELRFRLAALAASFLEDRGPGRVALYRRIKLLYDYRSKAVHGAATKDALLEEHIIEVRALLSRLMCRMTEAGTLPSVDEFEERLFT
ncbi:hypothetical protein LFL96_19055 [Paraburkholderia sp. D15]|uniref:hypothetical protein n=1 Tax=Paraburkholderia sp. D15 TaxID=2880218 RepID=UPI00247B10BA|nr:hypothetical protein [Paraburkholderia sp. D15]WGS49821.1 hypothetical protein LFL96_19055 [Paraburkholderia sp. D15]